MSSSALPPPGNLPTWSRVTTLDRTRYPKAFVRDRFPLGGTTITPDPVVDTSLKNVNAKILERMSGPPQKLQYDKNIKFLQQQHAETLHKLHEELDILKRENKALQFKVILAHQDQGKPTIATDDNKQLPPNKDIKILVLEEQIKDLQHALKESSLKNDEMQHMVATMHSRFYEQKNDEDNRSDGTPTSMKNRRRKFTVSKASIPLPLNATLNPLRVRIGTMETPRVPTMEECEIIIQHLHEANCEQVAELSNMRHNLRISTKNSHNPAPDHALMKTYGPSETESFSDTRLPRITVKPPMKKTVKSATMVGVKVSLPALKNTISTTVVERAKRQNAVQRQRRSFK